MGGQGEKKEEKEKNKVTSVEDVEKLKLIHCWWEYNTAQSVCTTFRWFHNKLNRFTMQTRNCTTKCISKGFKNKHLYTGISFTNGKTRLTEDERLLQGHSGGNLEAGCKSGLSGCWTGAWAATQPCLDANLSFTLHLS